MIFVFVSKKYASHAMSEYFTSLAIAWFNAFQVTYVIASNE